MKKTSAVDKKIHRVIDANFNRASEGLRVVEDISRFFYDDKILSRAVKRARHKLVALVYSLGISYESLLSSRNSAGDVGSKSFVRHEFKRKGIKSVAAANLRRLEESLRVLEEFSKLINIRVSPGFKKLRFDAYTIEKNMLSNEKY